VLTLAPTAGPAPPGSVVSARRDRAGCVERGVDRLGARAVAHHHVDLVVEATPRDLGDGAAVREALERAPPQLHPRERQELTRADRVAPPDHDDDGAVGGHVVRGDLTVGVDCADAVAADHEHGARVVGRRLADGLDPRPAVRQHELDPASARGVPLGGGADAGKREHRQCGSRQHRSRPQESHLGPRILLVSAPKGRGKSPAHNVIRESGAHRPAPRRTPSIRLASESGHDPRWE
jgi:hypothetical protein